MSNLEMSRMTFLSAVLLATVLLVPLMMRTHAADISAFRSNLEKRYSTAHSLGNNYQFDPRDGWQTINVTNLQYKYSRSLVEDETEKGPRSARIPHGHGKRTSKKTTSKKTTKKTTKKAGPRASVKSSTNSTSATSVTNAANGLLGSVKSVVDTIKAIGNAEPVTITWYTGHDLLNPSCWSNPTWAPTDESFACALTLDGWTNRPKCFKFLELCNNPSKCVFVRVVDSCAGCAAGSKHVDLTKAAFTQLADLGEGLLTVQMREATDPDGWLENLWGPQVN